MVTGGCLALLSLIRLERGDVPAALLLAGVAVLAMAWGATGGPGRRDDAPVAPADVDLERGAGQELAAHHAARPGGLAGGGAHVPAHGARGRRPHAVRGGPDASLEPGAPAAPGDVSAAPATPVGFAGLGSLGRPMAERLHSAGTDAAGVGPRPGAGAGARRPRPERGLRDRRPRRLRDAARRAPGRRGRRRAAFRGGRAAAVLPPGGVVVVHSTLLPATVTTLAAEAAGGRSPCSMRR